MTSERAGAIALVIMFAIAATLISVAVRTHETGITTRIVKVTRISTDDEYDRQLLGAR